MGPVKERILEVDHQAMCMRYSAISTPANIEHHLATIRILSNGDSCQLQWTTEIAPDQYASLIEEGIKTSLDALSIVLNAN